MKDLIELLSIYSVGEILIFIVLLALAFKGVVDFYDWAKKKIRDRMGEITDGETEKDTIKNNIDELFKMQKAQKESIDKLTESVNLLIQSDKDDIKAWITEKHHYYCYQLKYIDDFSLDCIEKRYAHYKKEGGNSFVEDLMRDLRSLRKVSSTLVRQEQSQINEEKK